MELQGSAVACTSSRVLANQGLCRAPCVARSAAGQRHRAPMLCVKASVARSSSVSTTWLSSRAVRMQQHLTHASPSSYELAPDDLFQPPEDERVQQSSAMPDDEVLEAEEAEEGEEQAADGWLSNGAAYVNEDGDERERVYLVGASLKRDVQGATASGYGICESLEELGRLSDTAGLKVVGSTYQILETPNNATYIGSGKVTQVARAVRALNVETVIFDDELSPGQLRNLERAMNGGGEQPPPEQPRVKVCDRTALILDIFSQRAATREGKLQVELAQTEYQLPRLTRMWSHLDRVGGGGQVKGTGEKQIETDKRLLRDRVAQLRRELEAVRTHRRNYRERRNILPVPVVALVGYTNAGKSTLLNTLTQAGVLAEDKLFATLDPTTRKIRLKGNKEVLVSDTVGFIQKLPTELVAAFRATLEEIQDAALLLHVVDISHPHAQAQAEAVDKVLAELNIGDIPLITAWNKVDRCPDPEQVRAVAAMRPDPTLCISGQTGEGLPELLSAIGAKLASVMEEVEVHVPFRQGDVVDLIHSTGDVLETKYDEEGVYLRARVPPSVAGRLLPYAVGETAAAAQQQVQQQQQPRSSKAARRRDVWTEEERLLHTQAQEAAA